MAAVAATDAYFYTSFAFGVMASSRNTATDYTGDHALPLICDDLLPDRFISIHFSFTVSATSNVLQSAIRRWRY